MSIKISSKLNQKLESFILNYQPFSNAFNVLQQHEKEELVTLLKQKLEALNAQHDHLSQIMARALDLSPNRNQWDNNHLKITKAIHKVLFETAQLPSQNKLAEITGLSRTTIIKHLNQSEDKPVTAEEQKQFTHLAPYVLKSLSRAALTGNIPAIKLYFQITEKMRGGQPVYNQPLHQNNYIQINNTILKQETLQQLTTAQLKQIEKIIKRNLPPQQQSTIEEALAEEIQITKTEIT